MIVTTHPLDPRWPLPTNAVPSKRLRDGRLMHINLGFFATTTATVSTCPHVTLTRRLSCVLLSSVFFLLSRCCVAILLSHRVVCVSLPSPTYYDTQKPRLKIFFFLLICCATSPACRYSPSTPSGGSCVERCGCHPVPGRKCGVGPGTLDCMTNEQFLLGSCDTKSSSGGCFLTNNISGKWETTRPVVDMIESSVRATIIRA